MQTINWRCCGLDVHKKTICACIRVTSPDGSVGDEVRTFSTMTRGILALRDWLTEQQVGVLAMESTGVYWKPIWNLLEDQFEMLLVNAHHIKHVPGRKTDVQDCQWIAQLLACGLLAPSFVPPRPQRQMRELTRHRATLVQEKSRLANRIQKVLEDANIKLASVATDVLGVSGRAMLKSMIDGQSDAATLAEMARKRLRGKIPQLKEALQGHVDDHHRFLLGQILAQVEFIENQIAQVEARIEALMGPFEEAVARADTVPGVERTAAQGIIAEIGPDMSRFPTAAHLSSWAGISPGNNESAGKRKSGKTTKGSPWLKRLLVQAAWAASHTKNTYLGAQYRRLARKRGRKRALVAVAHSILVMLWHMLSRGADYQELGEEYFERRTGEQQTRSLVQRLEKLGHKVILEAA